MRAGLALGLVLALGTIVATPAALATCAPGETTCCSWREPLAPYRAVCVACVAATGYWDETTNRCYFP
jgi:hypothetical protein